MSKSILLSIHPVFARAILAGEKRFEFRTRMPQKAVETIYLYATVPVGKVIGKVDVISKLSGTKESIWDLTKEYVGISKEEFERYFAKSKEAHCYQLANPEKLDLTLKDFGVKRGPMNFCYCEQVRSGVASRAGADLNDS